MHTIDLVVPGGQQTAAMCPWRWAGQAEMRGCRIHCSVSGQPDTTSEWMMLDPSDSSCKQLFEFPRDPVRALQRYYLEELGWKGCLLLVGLGVCNQMLLLDS